MVQLFKFLSDKGLHADAFDSENREDGVMVGLAAAATPLRELRGLRSAPGSAAEKTWSGMVAGLRSMLALSHRLLESEAGADFRKRLDKVLEMARDADEPKLTAEQYIAQQLEADTWYSPASIQILHIIARELRQRQRRAVEQGQEFAKLEEVCLTALNDTEVVLWSIDQEEKEVKVDKGWREKKKKLWRAYCMTPADPGPSGEWSFQGSPLHVILAYYTPKHPVLVPLHYKNLKAEAEAEAKSKANADAAALDEALAEAEAKSMADADEAALDEVLALAEDEAGPSNRRATRSRKHSSVNDGETAAKRRRTVSVSIGQTSAGQQEQAAAHDETSQMRRQLAELLVDFKNTCRD